MLAPGAVLQERYEITGLIGQGGMGAVYRAIDRRLGHTVAIKQILPQNQALRAAFEQEARLLAALRHPALPSVTDHFIETSVVEYGPGDAEAGNLGAESQMSSGHFLVMEYIPGDDLATLALRRSQPPGVDEVLRWADQLLDVLDYLHSRTPPVIHRDIKPHNLKINARGALVLLDFGLAKGAPGQAPSERSLAGYTLHYAAPEQLRGEPSDATSDLYSLAATLYDLLAARL
jgi:serine/threonine protein kinase